ncbi:MAG: DUF1800 domain-containing protein [Rhodobacteraceae bacterium]|nr:DUF1800 domain-containing protein [Paracoccaceae bacterium]
MTPPYESIAAVRFCYGFRPGEARAGPEALLKGVARGARHAGRAQSTLPGRMKDYATFARLRRSPHAGSEPEQRAARSALDRRFALDSSERVRQAVLSPHGFYERLVWFWADHFTVVARNRRGNAVVPSFEVDAIRPHVAGTFAGLLRAAVSHPAMLEYFGQARSTGPGSQVGLEQGVGLNENLAREVLELHTLGVGADYAQDDVRQFAELLTGLAVDRRTGEMAFRADMAEPGDETVLGRSYGGARERARHIDAALDDLSKHPATARHIARKLAVHFVADAPDEGLVAHLEAAYRRDGGELMPVYAALLEHPASWDRLGAKVRQPFDFVVATLRTAGTDHLTALEDADQAPDPVAALRRMNQPLWGAPGPDGWPEAPEAWISPPGLTARIAWASLIGQALAPRVDPRDFIETALGELARDETRVAARVAAERWEGIALVLASPEFNRR